MTLQTGYWNECWSVCLWSKVREKAFVDFHVDTVVSSRMLLSHGRHSVTQIDFCCVHRKTQEVDWDWTRSAFMLFHLSEFPTETGDLWMWHLCRGPVAKYDREWERELQTGMLFLLQCHLCVCYCGICSSSITDTCGLSVLKAKPNTSHILCEGNQALKQNISLPLWIDSSNDLLPT